MQLLAKFKKNSVHGVQSHLKFSYHSLSNDATIMVSKNCPITGEHVGVILMTQ